MLKTVAYLILFAVAPVLAGDYAVVVSKSTLEDTAWKKVVDALVEKHSATVITYEKDVNESREPLAKMFPRYACFVAKPADAGREFVVKIHRLTRQLDDDPYTDVMWGIVTGFKAEDALRIASAKEPLIIKKAGAGTGIDLNLFDEGKWFNESVAGEYWEKAPNNTPEKKKGAVDSAPALAQLLNEYQPDIFFTSGHATERDWQPGYSYKCGDLRCKDGVLVARDLDNKFYPIRSANPKVYIAAGNCLIGHVKDTQSMALAWMGSGGANQFVGYTVVTWYGAMGWGTKDYLTGLPGRYDLAESFFFSNQHILARLEKDFPDQARFNFEKWDLERNPGILDAYARELKAPKEKTKDLLGLLWDRDTVAFYGDPAWDARLAPRELNFSTELVEKDGEFHFIVNAKKEGASGKPLAMILPKRLKNVEVVNGKELSPLITDNFIMLLNSAPYKEGKTEVVFKAQYAE